MKWVTTVSGVLPRLAGIRSGLQLQKGSSMWVVQVIVSLKPLLFSRILVSHMQSTSALSDSPNIICSCGDVHSKLISSHLHAERLGGDQLAELRLHHCCE